MAIFCDVDVEDWGLQLADTGNLRDYYYVKRYGGKKKLYCNQWDFGYQAPPKYYSCTKDGEPSYECHRPVGIPLRPSKEHGEFKRLKY